MSTYRGIEQVTKKLVDVLKRQGVAVTARPPDKAREGITATQVNVFLYQTAIHPTWRNQDLPRSNSAGQPGRPLLPLNLYYLITAYGSDSASTEISDVSAHEALGRAMLTIHDAPELHEQTTAIRNQPGPLRITFQPLSVDEMTKLWSSFQTGYRPSVAYEVSALLIESELSSPTPLPVQRRGDDDRGWDSTSQFPPAITGVRFRTEYQPGVKLGESFTLSGHNLQQRGSTKVRFDHPRRNQPLFLNPASKSDRELTVRIPDETASWPAGVYTVAVQKTVGAEATEHAFASNSVRVDLLPEILVPHGGLRVKTSGVDRSIEINCRPQLHLRQSVQLLIGSVSFHVPVVKQTGNFTVAWKSSGVEFPPNNKAFARLRVDGVDSLISDPEDPRQGFDPDYEVGGIS